LSFTFVVRLSLTLVFAFELPSVLLPLFKPPALGSVPEPEPDIVPDEVSDEVPLLRFVLSLVFWFVFVLTFVLRLSFAEPWLGLALGLEVVPCVESVDCVPEPVLVELLWFVDVL
jgi:hypothetical protein